MIRLMLLLILAHLVADFILQTEGISRSKEEFKFSACFIHFFLTFAVTFLFIFNYGLIPALLISATLAVIHILIDLFKGLLGRWIKNTPMVRLFLFIGDQALHLLSITVVFSYIIKNSYDSQMVISMGRVEPLTNFLHFFLIDLNKLILLLIFYIVIMFAGTVFLDLILGLVNRDFEYYDTRVSRYIGVIERGLLLTLVTFGPITSVGLILTAKSLARFNKLGEREFAEYYLLGTLTSMSIALVGGLILNNLLALL